MIDVEGIKSLPKKDLLELLQIRHPHWKAMKDEWILHDQVRQLEISEDYLPKGELESIGEFNQRKELAVFTPETPMVIQRIIGFLQRQSPDRDINDKEIKDFIDMADRRRRVLNDVLIEAIKQSLWFGVSFMLVDRKTIPMDESGVQVPPNSQTESMQILGNPYVVLYKPIQAVNYSINENCQLEWITIRESKTVQEKPSEPRELRIYYRIFDEQNWIVVELRPKPESGQSKSKVLEVKENSPDQVLVTITSGTHNLGMNPIVPLIPFPEDAMTGQSFVKAAVRHDVAAWRVESDHRFNLWLHNHPRLVIKAVKDVMQGLKSSSAIHLNPDKEINEDAFYISPPTEVFEHSREQITEDRKGVWIQTYQDAVARITESRQTEQSGIHKRMSFEMAEGAILSHLTNILVDIEYGILERVARYYSPVETLDPNDSIFNGEITRKKTYDVFWIGDYTETAEKALPFIQSSPTLMELVAKRMSRALLDDPGQETIQRIGEEFSEDKSMLTPNVEKYIERLASLQDIGTPSPSLIEELLKRLATEIVGEEKEHEATLETIFKEIESADLESKRESDFDSRVSLEAV